MQLTMHTGWDIQMARNKNPDRIQQLIEKCTTTHVEYFDGRGNVSTTSFDKEKFAKLIIKETLEQVSERTYGRGENQWYYKDDERWIKLHFGYGALAK